MKTFLSKQDCVLFDENGDMTGTYNELFWVGQLKSDWLSQLELSSRQRGPSSDHLWVNLTKIEIKSKTTIAISNADN